jgi:hypothetical protein
MMTEVTVITTLWCRPCTALVLVLVLVLPVVPVLGGTYLHLSLARIMAGCAASSGRGGGTVEFRVVGEALLVMAHSGRDGGMSLLHPSTGRPEPQTQRSKLQIEITPFESESSFLQEPCLLAQDLRAPPLSQAHLKHCERRATSYSRVR